MKAHRAVMTAALGIMLLAAPAAAQQLSEPSERAGRWSFSFIPKFQFSEGIDFKGGSHLSTDEDLGLGFSFGFQPGERLAIGMDFGWNSIDYHASLASATTPGLTDNISGWFESGGTNFNLTLNLLPRRMTPYVQAGIGWVWIDTNIPSGDVDVGCWWDPWYGYICTPYQQTRSTDGIQYTGGAGLRFDSGRDFFIKLGYDARFLDLENADTLPAFDAIRLEFGSMF